LGALSQKTWLACLLTPMTSCDLHRLPKRFDECPATCDSYASEFCMSFNASKSICLAIFPANRRYLPTHFNKYLFSVGNKPIESFSHIGHLITSLTDDGTDISRRRCDFIGQVNAVLCYFQKPNPFCKHILFTSHCSRLYRCDLRLLSSDMIDERSITWLRSLHAVCGLPNITHCHLLPLTGNCLHVFDGICHRSQNFIKSCLLHKTVLVRSVVTCGLFFTRFDSKLVTAYCSKHSNITAHLIIF
jgi:hypothetical protein